MRAVTYTRFGPAAETLEIIDHPTPTPDTGEVLVRLKVSGVNPSDAKARSGARPGVTKPAFPTIIPHSDGAGVVEAVGDGVDAARIGQRVWIWNGQWQRAFGTAAHFMTVPAQQAVPLPEGVGFDAGATLGSPGLTAAQTVFSGGNIEGKTLLISGGAGAVGHNAVQLAKFGGAHVIATSSPKGADRVKTAGADHVLDYADPDLAEKIRAANNGKGIDRAVEVEFGTNTELLVDVMAENGSIAAYGSFQDMTPTLPFGPYMFKALTLDFTLIYILPWPAREKAIEVLHAALSKGALTPAIHARYSMSDCAKAQDAVMSSGRAGAVLLDID